MRFAIFALFTVAVFSAAMVPAFGFTVEALLSGAAISAFYLAGAGECVVRSLGFIIRSSTCDTK